MHRWMAVVAPVLVAFALAGCGGSGGISLPCSPQPQGQLCIQVFHDGLTVKDAIGYLAASESPLAGKTWRLGLSVSTQAGRLYPGRPRHGNPPRATTCRPSGTTALAAAPPGCHVTLAAAYASHGDFAGFDPPKSFSGATELCVVEQVQSGGVWKTAARPAPACTRIR